MVTSLHLASYLEFCRRLRQAREASGLTHAEVRRRLRRDQTFVSKIETGERRLDLIEAAELGAIYGCPPASLVPPKRS